MNVFTLIISVLLFIELSNCTLSPPKDRNSKKSKGKIEIKKGPVGQDVFSRILVVKNPKTHDIIRESGFYFSNTTRRRFTGEVLGYITPWNNNGIEVSKIFHGKFTMVSPVWLAFPEGNASTYKLSTHDVQKKWLKEMKATNNENHHVKILPRVLFEHWSVSDIVGLYSDTHKQTTLISALVDTAKYSEFFPPLLPSKLQEDNTCITGNYQRSLICNPSDCVILLRVESYEIQVNLRITCMKCRWSIIILQLTQSKRFISFFDHTQRIQFTQMSFVA